MYDMPIDERVLLAVNELILPYVLRAHQTAVPYPAELWAGKERLHEHGVAMFGFGPMGYLIAEYFAYDNNEHFWMESPPQGDVTLVMKALEIQIPIWWMRPSHKSRTIYQRMGMPAVHVYECIINGWVGGPDSTPVRSASLTLSGLPDLRLPRSQSPISDKSTDTAGLTFQATEIESATLVLTCGDWQVKLSQGVLTHEQTLPTVYLATVAKQDGSTFTLGEDALDNGIVGALFQFLSFQAGRWIEIPTIICHPPTTGNPLVDRAWLGKLASDEDKPHDGWTSSHWPDWPSQFNHFWKKYTDAKTHNHLRHAVQHYVDCDRIFNDGALNYSIVASRSTLEALTRWWNDLGEDFHFGSGRGKHFDALLTEAVKKAALGADRAKQIDLNGLSAAISDANRYRNRIDHGRGGAEGIQTQEMVDYQMYCHNLARYLILAQLGDRGTYERGFRTGPKFINRPT